MQRVFFYRYHTHHATGLLSPTPSDKCATNAVPPPVCTTLQAYGVAQTRRDLETMTRL
uniref:Uncharacterized protein n=1 Tax=Anopheles quadriannulatus TaxID=34691 RepID=A0A182XQR0_ANOQN